MSPRTTLCELYPNGLFFHKIFRPTRILRSEESHSLPNWLLDTDWLILPASLGLYPPFFDQAEITRSSQYVSLSYTDVAYVRR